MGRLAAILRANNAFDFDDLLSYIVQETEVGQTASLHLLRDGEPLVVDIILEARPESEP